MGEVVVAWICAVIIVGIVVGVLRAYRKRLDRRIRRIVREELDTSATSIVYMRARERIDRGQLVSLNDDGTVSKADAGR